MVDPELLELMQATVRFRPPGTRNVAGEYEYTADWTTARCHLTFKSKVLGGTTPGTGESRVAVATATLDDVYEVTQDWQVELPARSPLTGRTVFIAEVGQNWDENGPYNTVLYLGAK